MSYYYCDTCKKTLQRSEQRHNKERTSSTRGVVVGQLNNLPGHPLIGIPIRNEQEINVVRCVKCGSDARVCYTPAEQRTISEDQKEKDAVGMAICVIFGIVILICVILVIRAAIEGNRLDKEQEIRERQMGL